MPTVILGGGIIAASIAYYLTEHQQQSQQEIHIIESAPELFSSASGFAAGFLAKDWFEPSLLPLGEYSFALHESLAAEHGGDKKWGYMKGTALSLGSTDAGAGGARGDDYDPLRLSHFLLERALSRGVTLHQPAKATAIIQDSNGTLTGIEILNLSTNTISTLPCTTLIFATAAWTSSVFTSLFPTSTTTFPIYPLAGYSLVLRSPRYTAEHEKAVSGQSHAVFTTHPPSCGFSPEMFSREGGEIYIAGLNSRGIPVPDSISELKDKFFQKSEMDKLKSVANRLMGSLPSGISESADELSNVNDLTIVREGLCLRPVAERGVPFVSRVGDELLGGVKTKRGGGVFVAAGHGPWGITLSLGTGRVVADLARGLKPQVDISGLGVKEGSAKAKL
ncbi:FAD dependent oxidoreductase-domain-containing protein [Aspergillus karnatakaensis]|uniref:NAD(P)/FAD-dependent oxidoreductase n=1 Tax=Aspergillus karnatakaensis TaxID=1810916 RepID=UPI003CCCB98A